jgi:Calcineurin-like phosphoesterase
MSLHLVIPDPHAHPNHNNDRADWIGQFIKDIKPDVVVNLGDAADMASLASYDKGKRAYHGKSYSKDIEAHLDFQERMWAPMYKTKKRLPRSIVLEGNHEQRVERALDLSPELQGTIGFRDYDFDYYYDDVVRYEGQTPGVIEVDGVLYAHYFTTGVMGRPSAGIHPAYALNVKQAMSSVQGHTHTLDFNVHVNGKGKKLMSLVAGCGFDYDSDWAGVVNRFYWRGVILLHDVEDGVYDPEMVSLARLKAAYGT